jgi:7,8-dihydropterin-6-yl-methyl-4-(beta-D-ribofuranosyl)aminobenzene 5'-phosphate synthase
MVQTTTQEVSPFLGYGSSVFHTPPNINPKYALDSDEPRYIGFPKSIPPETLKLNYITETTQIKPKMWIFNHTENYCDFETIPEYMVIKDDDKF